MKTNDYNRQVFRIRALGISLLFLLFFCGSDPAFVRFWVTERNIPGDFDNYYQGGFMLSHGNTDIYNPDACKRFFSAYPGISFTQLNYPPVIYIFFSCFSRMPLHQLKTLWYYFNIFLLLITMVVLFLSKPFEGWALRTRAVVILYCITFAILFSPGQDNLMMGQINIVLTFLLTGGFFFYLKGGYAFSGFLVGIAASVKLFPGIAALAFIPKGRRQGLIGFAVGFIAPFVLSYLLFGAPLIKSFLKYGSSGYLAWYDTTSHWLQSVPSMISYWASFLSSPQNPTGSAFLAGPVSVIIGLLTIAATIFAILEDKGDIRNNPLRDMALFNSLLSSIFLISPLIWPYYLVLLLPTLSVIFYIFYSKDRRIPENAEKTALLMLATLVVIGAFGGVVPNAFHRLSPFFWKFREFFLSNRLTPLFVGFLWYLQLSMVFFHKGPSVKMSRMLTES